MPYGEVKARKKPKAPKRLKPVNPKTGGHRFAANVNEGLRGYVRTLPCLLAGRQSAQSEKPHQCVGVTECCHLKTRGSGAPDDNNVWPGCRLAHLGQEGKTKDFEWYWQINLKAVCKKVTADFYGSKGLR